MDLTSRDIHILIVLLKQQHDMDLIALVLNTMIYGIR